MPIGGDPFARRGSVGEHFLDGPVVGRELVGPLGECENDGIVTNARGSYFLYGDQALLVEGHQYI